jgi:phage gp36-like protein
MSYATTADVQARIPTAVLTIGAGTEPSSATVDGWLTSASAWIDSSLAWKYLMPVTDPSDLELLRPICAALVAAQVFSVLAASDATLDAMVRSLRAEALSALVYSPGGAGTWMEGGATVITSKDLSGIGRAMLVLRHTALEDSGEAALDQPLSTFSDPLEDDRQARMFNRSIQF